MDLPKNTRRTPDSSIRGTIADCISQAKKFEEIGIQELVFIPSNYDIQQVEFVGKKFSPHSQNSTYF